MSSQPRTHSKTHSGNLSDLAVAKQTIDTGTTFGTPDDMHPGTYFRIPSVPRPGKTTWSLVK